MKSIFNTDDNTELISRINQLKADSLPLWGKMTPAQMMAHCCCGMDIAFGNSKCYRHWVGVLFGNFAKNRTLKAKELDRNIPAYIKLRIEDDRNFEEEKKNLIGLVQTALQKGEAGLVRCPHPYFRYFKPGEWSQLNWKHFDHHLRQFGV